MEVPRYRTAPKLFEDLGGRSDPSVAKGLAKAIQKCIAMGPPWLSPHPQHEMMEYVVIERGWEEKFKHSWQKYVTAKGKSAAALPGHVASALEVGTAAVSVVGTGGTVGVGGATAAKEAAAAKTMATPGTGKAKGGKTKPAGETGNAVLPSGSPSHGKKTKTEAEVEFGKMMTKANKLKDTFLTQISRAVEVNENIKENRHWSWARGAKKEELDAEVAKVKSGMTEFHKELLLDDLSDLKKKHGNSTTEIELKAFVKKEKAITAFKSYLDGLKEATNAMKPADSQTG